MQEILMPRIDAAMQSGRVVQWLKKEGEQVSKGEPVVLVEGEKTTFEIEAPVSGLVKRINFSPGEDVPVGQAVAILGEPNEVIEEHRPPAETTPKVTRTQEATRPAIQVEPAISRETRASPAARALARRHGIDLAKVHGTGPHGRIQTKDVVSAVESLGPQVVERLGRVPRVKEIIALKGIRKAVAERLAHSFHTAVPVMLTMEADMQPIEEVRKKFEGAVSVTALVTKAVAQSLREHIILNSSLDGDDITVYDDINIAVAINTPDGLTAPVVFGPELMHPQAITERIAELRDMAISGKLSIQELTGGTFTVTNLGGEGVELFAPIINPPQAAILAMGRTVRKPIVIDDAIKIGSRATISLIFDHRVTDGVPAAKFIAHVKQLLENPDSLLSSS